MNDILQNIYFRLPMVCQNFACSLHGWDLSKIRYSDFFSKKYEELLEFEYWSESEIESYQNEKLQGLIKYAYVFSLSLSSIEAA